jgi:hypothetical protein
MEKPPGKRQLGRQRIRGEDNIMMNLREGGCEDRRCMDLLQHRFLG